MTVGFQEEERKDKGQSRKERENKSQMTKKWQ